MKIYASKVNMKVISIGLDVQLPNNSWTSKEVEDYISELIDERNTDGSQVLATDFKADVSDSYEGVEGVRILSIGLDVEVPAFWTYDTLEGYIEYLVNEVDDSGVVVVAADFIADVTRLYKYE